jgi:DNA-binding CsgD family transcriptional regulator
VTLTEATAPPLRPARLTVARPAAQEARQRDARPRRLRRPLTAREIEVLALIADGKTNEEVAAQLGIARHTVKSHMAHILDALGAMNTAAATSARAARSPGTRTSPTARSRSWKASRWA